MGEVITLHIGQAGVGMGAAFWAELYREHGLDETAQQQTADSRTESDANPTTSAGCDESGLHRFFNTSCDGRLVPRALFVDLDDVSINRVRKGPLREQFSKNTGFVLGKEDSSNSYSRGYYTAGREVINQIQDKIRKHTESCDSLQGFLITHSIAGGCGSGLGALISERLSVEYGKKNKIHYTWHPDYSSSETIVSPFNSILSIHALLEHSDTTVLMQNSSMIDCMGQNLDIPEVSFDHVNRLAAPHAASILSGLRYSESGGISLNQITSPLTPYPRIHFACPSFSPWSPSSSAASIQNAHSSIYTSVSNLMEPESVFCSARLLKSPLMSAFLMFRGEAAISECHLAAAFMQQTKWPDSAHSWTPTPFAVACNPWKTGAKPHPDLDLRGVTAAALTNSSACVDIFRKAAERYDQMLAKRGFFWWFYGEGMEKGEFWEAREDLEALCKDYESCAQPPVLDDGIIDGG